MMLLIDLIRDAKMFELSQKQTKIIVSWLTVTLSLLSWLIAVLSQLSFWDRLSCWYFDQFHIPFDELLKLLFDNSIYSLTDTINNCIYEL